MSARVLGPISRPIHPDGIELMSTTCDVSVWIDVREERNGEEKGGIGVMRREVCWCMAYTVQKREDTAMQSVR